ncbi:MAG TPA: hypothetical protein VN179_08285 [Solirubrobacterales bacterium]|nr:hypothetical protein [Solirubrobacterales bacterium]
MERMAWTDERLEERFARIDERFDGVDRRLDNLTTETRALKQGMESLHSTMHRGNYALITTMFGVILAILIKGG